MPFDATHIVFACTAARGTDPLLLRTELLAGAIAPDSVGTGRAFPMARSHFRIHAAARVYARAGSGAGQPSDGTGSAPPCASGGARNAASGDALRAFAFGYLSHVWLDRFIPRWLPRQSLVMDGRRLDLRGLYPLLARRDAEEALYHWRALGCGSAVLDPEACRFVDLQVLGEYCAGAEVRFMAVPALEPDESAPALLASERMKAAALQAFKRACRATSPRVL